MPLLSLTVEIDNFVTDIYSKSNNSLKKVELSLTYDVNQTKTISKVRDGLNIVISSFYIEDLFTSKNKERFKEMVIEYVAKKHKLKIKNIYLQNLQLKDSINTKELIEELKKEGLLIKNKYNQPIKQ